MFFILNYKPIFDKHSITRVSFSRATHRHILGHNLFAGLVTDEAQTANENDIFARQTHFYRITLIHFALQVLNVCFYVEPIRN